MLAATTKQRAVPIAAFLALLAAGQGLRAIDWTRPSGPPVSVALLQAGMSRQVRGALLWPGAGVPLALLIVALDLPSVPTLGLLAALMVAGVVAGFLLHRAGEVRTAKV